MNRGELLTTSVVLTNFIIFFLFKIGNFILHLLGCLRDRRLVQTEAPHSSGENQDAMELVLLKEAVRLLDWARLWPLPVVSAHVCELLCVFYQENVVSGTAVLLGINVVEYGICRYARREDAAGKNIRLLWRQKEMYKSYCERLQADRDKYRKLRHDIKKQYFMERMYLERGEYDLLLREYDRVGAVVVSKEVITGHVMMDAILTYGRSEADRRQIELYMEVSVPADLSILDFHLNALLGNILDNAVKYTQSGGRIRIKIIYDRKNLFIKCRNAPLMLPQHRMKNTDEQGHGIGLQIVRDVVAIYNGSMEIKKTAVEYAVMIILELSYQKLH